MADLDVDLATAAYDWLLTDPAFHEMVADGLIGTDAPAASTIPERLESVWVFQGLDDEGRPRRNPEATGQAVIVLSSRTDWSSPNRHNSFAFPALQVLIYADSTRDANGAVVSLDATRKAKHIAKRITDRFHVPASRQMKWGDLWVHSSLRSNALDIRDVPMTQAATVRAELKFEVATD